MHSATTHWFLQAASGTLLVFLLAIHLLVNHWAAPQGLLTYADVIRYYDIPGIAWMEAIFLAVVASHGLLGVHSLVLDLNLSPKITGILRRVLILVGAIAILYGIWLIGVICAMSVS